MKLPGSVSERLASPLGRLAGHSLIYGLAGMAGSLASVVLTPLYARYLGPAAYGQLETLLAMVQIVTILAAFGAGSAALALIIRPEGEPASVAGSAMAVVAVIGAVCLGIGYLIAPIMAAHLGLPTPWVRLVSFCGYLTALAQIPFAIWRARGKAWLLAGFTFVQVLATLGMNVCEVAWWGHGADGILHTLLIVQGASFLIGGAMTRHEWWRGIDWATIKDLLSFGSTHVCNSLATWVVQLSDRFLLVATVAAAEVGHYTLGNKISFIAQLLLATPLAMSWPSFLQQMGQDRHVEQAFGRLFATVASYGFGLLLFISLFAKELILLFGGSGYLSAAGMVPILAAAVLINAVMPMLLAGLGLAMNFRYYPLITFIGAGVNLLLNLWWIPYWGALGSAWATLLAYVTAAVVGRALSESLRPLPIAWRDVGLAAGWMGLLFLIGTWMELLAVRIPLLLLYPVGIFAWHRARSSDRMQGAPALAD